jgi:hypothetical protein
MLISDFTKASDGGRIGEPDLTLCVGQVRDINVITDQIPHGTVKRRLLAALSQSRRAKPSGTQRARQCKQEETTGKDKKSRTPQRIIQQGAN